MPTTKWDDPIESGVPIDIANDGTIVAGVYNGYETFKNQRSGGMSKIHEVQLLEEARVSEHENGTSLRFWGTKDLDTKLAKVRSGQLVRIEYKETMGLSQGKTMKIFEVRSSASVDDNEPPLPDEVPF